MKYLFPLLALCAAAHASRTPPPDASGTRVARFALAIGSAFGGPGRDTLLYASTDASAFAKVLEDMGGVPEANARVLPNPAPADLERALAALRREVEAAQRPGLRTEVIVYYSGHADDKGLLLGDKPYDYDRFRRGMDSIPAHVRIAVLDACASGAITRIKGGRRRPAFTVDAASDMRGYAFLTSSSPEEASQESDQLGSSFFTHYLVSGLRGAADVSGDGKVTLGEAYQFAFHETLARTERTKGGPQHPAYDMKLSGTGDVVMTDMRETSAGLTLGPDLEGRFFVRAPAGQLVAELYKPRGRAMELGLPPRRYEVRLEAGSNPMAADVDLEEGKRRALAAGDFRGAPVEGAVARGKGGIAAGAEGAPADSSRGFGLEVKDQMEVTGPRKFTFSLGFLFNHQSRPFRGLQLCLFVNHASRSMQGGQISVFDNGVGGSLAGTQLSVLGNWVLDSLQGLQLSPIFNVTRGPVTGGQGSAILNVSGPVDGGQGSAVANIATGPVSGGQGAAVANIAWGKVNGGQASGVLNVSRGVQGGQVAAVANLSAGDAQGAQVSAVLNAARDVLGTQATAVANAARDVRGVQASAVLNAAHDVAGTQATAVLNAARDVHGVQISAVLNAAHDVDGWQIGVVNVSHDVRNGAPIGLFNYSQTGLHSLNLSVDELGFQTATLLSGGRYFYTYFSAGDKLQTKGAQMALGGGLGVQIPRGPWFGSAELGVQDFHYDYDFDGQGPELYRLRFTAGRELLPYVSAFGGLSLNAYWHQHDQRETYPWGDYQFRVHDNVYGWPGLFLGLRLGR